ncbi:MAG TPA: ATP-binding protein, partial [Bacteroidales bacterium]|nr:ATP-binding protein [Bacteroidales bacterium]HPS17491.1 ATP-binding protein [Bacteroidales bacterium]
GLVKLLVKTYKKINELLLNGILTSRIRLQEKKIRIREERTQALYQLTKEISSVTNINDITKAAIQNIKKYFNLESVIILKNEANRFEDHQQYETNFKLSENDISIAAWVFRHSAKAGKYTETLPSSNYTFYPLTGNSANMGVVAVEHRKNFTQGEEQFWDAFLSQISGKYEREFLRDATKKDFLKRESDKLYKNIFDSISNELQIPLSSIVSATEELMVNAKPDKTQQKYFSEINGGIKQLKSLVKNLFNMSHIETGQIQINPEWCDVKELINNVTETLKHELESFNLSVIIPDDIPKVYIDFGLIEQVLYHLVKNAIENTSSGSTIRMKFFYDDGVLSIIVMDRGKVIQEAEMASLFNNLYRVKKDDTRETGLGFSIIKSFVEAHNGTVTAKNRLNGGVEFTVKIPVNISEK